MIESVRSIAMLAACRRFPKWAALYTQGPRPATDMCRPGLRRP
jgi:hypothetical protein